MNDNIRKTQVKKRTLFEKFWQGCIVAVILFLIGAIGYGTGTFFPNYIVKDQLQDTFHKEELKQLEFLGLEMPEFEYNDSASFIVATKKCIEYLNYTTDRRNRVPTSIIVAMAGVESAWGTSRFANEGNALFGVRTWDLENVPHMKAKGNPDANWGVKKYTTKCESVKDMIRIINNHPAYEGFRVERAKQIDNGQWNYSKLMSGLSAWSTNPRYGSMILATIVDKKLP